MKKKKDLLMEIVFPLNNNKYYNTHYRYVLSIFNAFPDTNIVFEPVEYFIVGVNGKRCLFDYSDYFDIAGYNPRNFDYVFKFHKHYDVMYPDNVLPFPPISFYNWDKYLYSSIQYAPNKAGISMRQKSYGNARERRNIVRDMLVKEFGSEVRTSILEQDLYFLEVEDIFLGVFVPGAQENMLDRGQFQYMAYGVPTISPMIPELLTYDIRFQDVEDYIACRNDYSDLIDIIIEAKKQPEFMQQMGSNAMVKFLDTSTPINLYRYFKKIFGE